jgi:hypothetical protein
MPIARQRVAKHIPAEADAKKNRRCIARQRRSKQALSTMQALFSLDSCKVDIRESSSEAGSCGSMEYVQRSTTELVCERRT